MRESAPIKARSTAGVLLFCGAGAVILAFFLHFSWRGLGTYFSSDDMMNLHYYWSRPVWTLIRSNVLFATDYYRPMGGLFYLGMYSAVGFHPLPFRIAVFGLLIANLFVWYSVARRLSGSREVGALSVLIASLHASMIDLYFDTATIYDVLCYFFYFSAILFYLRVRQREAIPSVPQTVLVLLLYVASLNSKEMGVSLPIMLMAYEVIWHPPISLRCGAMQRWLAAEARTALMAAGLTVRFIVGKAAGPESLAHHPAYQPEISVTKYLTSSGHYIGALFYHPTDFGRTESAGILAVVVVAALLLRRRHLLWSVTMITFGILPLAFVRARNGFTAYIPFAGWALYFASVIAILKDRMLSLMYRLVPPTFAARLESRELTKVTAQVLLFALATWNLYLIHSNYLRYPLPLVLAASDGVRDTAMQIGSLLPKVPAKSRVLFLDDPLPAEDWRLVFLVRLYCHDPTLVVERAKKLTVPLTDEDKAQYDILLGYENGRYFRIKRPAVAGHEIERD